VVETPRCIAAVTGWQGRPAARRARRLRGRRVAFGGGGRQFSFDELLCEGIFREEQEVP
jgi:hypothetical protein